MEHLLQALAQEKGSIASEILHKANHKLDVKIPAGTSSLAAPNSQTWLKFGGEAAASLIKAVQISQQYGHKYIGTEHLLKSLAANKTVPVMAWWRQHGINLAELEKNLQIVLESTSKFPDLTAVFRAPGSQSETKEERLQAALEYFGRELTAARVQPDLDPVVGRELEINRLIHVLCRRYKNNPLLLGEAGVGKTAIVEGLAKKIAAGDVPPILANRKIYAIDLGAVVAGTIYRGEFEARFKNLIEAAEDKGNVILFIDEIHTIIGAGSASGSLDAANMLKPALARGQVSIIGATTLEEYKKHIETDSALERRLQTIMVNEPNEEETKAVLEGIKANYERFHNVTITDAAIASAVRLSNRYLTEKLQPDKAIDLLDEAAAKVKVARSQRSIWQTIRQLERARERVRADKRAAVSQEAYTRAISLKQEETGFNEQLEKLLSLAQAEDSRQTKVEDSHVLEVVAGMTKIPLGELERAERNLLSDLEDKLQAKIIGQAEALATVAKLIRRARAEVSNPAKPLASFMFLGPSGVGKTETAKQLAALLFRDPKALIKVDMSEFAEGFTVSRLIGSPAGYVGYRDGNKFTDLVRRAPYSVILLDEIEKAHPEVFNILLQVLEDGSLTDATGRTVNFKNTIIIMTSNLGLEEFNQSARLGFAAQEEPGSGAAHFANAAKGVRDSLKNHFRPEFLNRLDSIVVFRPLTKDNLLAIVSLYVQELNARLAAKSLSVSLGKKTAGYIVERAYAPEAGARGVRRWFQDNIESAVASLLLTEEVKGEIKVDVVRGQLAFSPN